MKLPNIQAFCPTLIEIQGAVGLELWTHIGIHEAGASAVVAIMYVPSLLSKPHDNCAFMHQCWRSFRTSCAMRYDQVMQ